MSSIVSIDINENFPVAGQDNDSQGFRDNFNIIKNSLATANAEITILENNTAKTNTDNNFNNNEIQEAVLVNTTQKTVSQATATSISINWSFGQHQKVTVTDDLTLTLTDWPASGTYGEITITVVADDVERTVSWAATEGNNIKYTTDGFSLNFTIQSSTNPKIFKFWSTDGGTTVYAQYLGEFVS